MRKKYLSALLFGALLFASAGTFTSCKDYDDDINNLQEQINTIKTDLASLTETVNNLDGVKTLSYADGMLIIETGKGTKVEVPVPSATGITTVELKDNVLYVDGKEAGKVEIAEGEAVKVEVKEDGKLYINGEVQDLEIGSKVVVVDNGNGTYTMTVDGTSYVLPKAVATDVTVTVDKNSYFTAFGVENLSNGISWGTASKDVDWKGPKGAVKAGQFLVGQITEINATVEPANTELDKMTLKLVDSDGNYAPVVVSAVPAGNSDMLTASRSVDKKGEWVLTIATDATVSETNMGSAFATTLSNGDPANKKYALSSDGRLLTGYNFVVDTDEKTTSKADLTFDEQYIRVDGTLLTNNATETGELVLNENHTLEYKLPDVYDYQFSILAADQNDAEDWDITLENNVLKGGEKAAGKSIHLVLSVIGVNGEVKTYENSVLTVKFGNVKADAEDLTPVTYKLTDARDAFVVDLGNTFSGLTSTQAVNLKDVQWTVDDKDAFLLKDLTQVAYYSDEACENQVTVTTWDSSDNIKKIKYAKFTVLNNVNSDVTPDEYTMTLTLKKDNTGNSGEDEIKKVNVAVTVTIPSFAEMFEKSAAWSNNVATLRFDAKGQADIKTLYYPLDEKSYNASWWSSSVFAPVNNTEIVSTNGATVTAKEDIANTDGSLKSTTAEVIYKVANKANCLAKSGEFTVKFLTILDGAQIVYYGADSKETTFSVNGSGATFTPGEKSGFCLELNGKKYVSGLGSNTTVEGLTLSNQNWDYKFDTNAGINATAKVDENGNIIVSNLASGNYKTKLTLIYTKSINNITANVNTPITIELDVKNGTAQN